MSDGAHVHYVDTGGAGPVIMLLPGWCMTTRWWHKQLAGLGGRYRVVSFDPRAYGESEKVPYGHTMARHAADVRDVLTELDLHDVTLVGWSLAANVPLTYYQLFGRARLARIGYLEMSPCPNDNPVWGHGWKLGEGTESTEKEFISSYHSNPGKVADSLIDDMFVHSPSPRDRAWMVKSILQTPVEVGIKIEWDSFNSDWRPMLPTVQLPVLVMDGRLSKLYPVETGTWLADHLPDARQVVFPRSGHVPFLEEPEAFNQAIAGFAGS